MNIHRKLSFLGLKPHNYAFLGLFTVVVFRSDTATGSHARWAVYNEKGMKRSSYNGANVGVCVNGKEGVFLK